MSKFDSKSRLFGDTSKWFKAMNFLFENSSVQKIRIIRFWAANHMTASSAAVLQKLFDLIPAWIAPDRHTKGFWTHIHLKHIQYISTSHCIWQCWILIKTWLNTTHSYIFSIIINCFQNKTKVPMFFIRIRILSASLFWPLRCFLFKRQQTVPSHREFTMHFFANGFGAKDVTSA